MCDGCECWLHQECLRMSTSQYVRFCAPHLQFFCKHCVSNGDSFCVSSSLSRIAVLSPDIRKMQDQADSELNLMQFYCIALPAIVNLSCKDVTVHRQSQLLLHDHSRWLLDQYVPVDVEGDGNCLYRSVSYALYGTQVHHGLL